MARDKLKTNPVSLMNCEILCLREEVNAEQWNQVTARLTHMMALVDVARRGEYDR